MTSANLKLLYNLVPGFSRDKDEEWITYLPQADQIYLRKGRCEFIVMKDRLDELKSDQKEYIAGTARHKQISQEVVEMTREVDIKIKSLLSRIPALKDKAYKARDIAIERDLAGPNRKRRATDINDDTYSSMASTFDVFLPSHMFQPKASEQAQLESSQPTPTKKAQQSSNEPAVDEQPARDTYLDGVTDCDIAIMKKLRPIVEKFDCKDRVLEALRRIRERDERLETLKDINSMAGKA